MHIARSTAQLLLVTSLAACGYGRFDASDSDRDNGLGEADCADAVEACDAFALSYCSAASECGFMSFSDCFASLEQDGWRCDFAEAKDGDMQQCAQELDAMSCDRLATANAFDGTECATASIGFGSDVCEERGGDDDGSAGGDTGGPSGEGVDYCTCAVRVTPGACGATIGCYWLSNDTANPVSSDGSCGGLCTP